MIKKMQAVVFDVGNVLVHWAPQIIEDELARISTADRARIITVQQAVRHEIGLGSLTAAEYHRYLVEAVGMDGHWDRFFEAYCLGLCRDDQALSYASLLKRRGVAIGVISNTNDVHVHWLCRDSRVRIFRLGDLQLRRGSFEARPGHLPPVAERARR